MDGRLYATSFIIISILGCAGNALIFIISLALLRSRPFPSILLILIDSVVKIFAIVFLALPVILYYLDLRSAVTGARCVVIMAANTAFALLAGILAVAEATDRFVAVTRPIAYKTYAKTEEGLTFTVVFLLVAFTFFILMSGLQHGLGDCHMSVAQHLFPCTCFGTRSCCRRPEYLVANSVFWGLMLTILVLVNIIMVYYLICGARQEADQSYAQPQKHELRNLFLRCTLVHMVVFLFGWSPLYVDLVGSLTEISVPHWFTETWPTFPTIYYALSAVIHPLSKSTYRSGFKHVSRRTLHYLTCGKVGAPQLGLADEFRRSAATKKPSTRRNRKDRTDIGRGPYPAADTERRSPNKMTSGLTQPLPPLTTPIGARQNPMNDQ